MPQGAPTPTWGAHLHAHLQGQLALTLALIGAGINQSSLLQPLQGSLERLIEAFKALIEHRVGMPMPVGEAIKAKVGRQLGGKSHGISLAGSGAKLGALEHGRWWLERGLSATQTTADRLRRLWR
jgi:hypothetical protein